MFHMCKDANGNDYGWAKVLDYIGVGWDPSTIGGNCKGQMRLEDFMQKEAEPPAGEVSNKTKSKIIVQILSVMSRNLSVEIATIKEEETEKEESED